MSFASMYDQLISDIDYDFIIDFVEKHISKDKSLLDVGCGTGVFSLELKKRGYQVTAIDNDTEMLAILSQKANEQELFIGTYLHDIKEPFKTSFDQMILLNDVINYFKGIKVVAKNLYHGLNKDGIIVLDLYKKEYLSVMSNYTEEDNMPFEYEWSIKVANNRMIHKLKTTNETYEFSQYIYDLNYYKNIFEKTGFKVIELDGPDERKHYFKLMK